MTEIPSPANPARLGRVLALLPGLGMCLAVTAASVLVERLELAAFGRAYIEALVIAILLGAAWRTLLPPAPAAEPGVRFAGKSLLELAVVLLGASISAQALAAAGPAMIFGIAGLVGVAIVVGYAGARLVGLGRRVAILIACGNAICGNSAIAAIAPVIGAKSDEVVASIAFTALLGVIVVLGLPPLGGALGLSMGQYGAFAGLTVYAVPQVIAATAPVSALSVQVGTLMKLVRVLMLGPVILMLSVFRGGAAGVRPSWHRLVPGFILAFLVMLALRSFGLIPEPLLGPIGAAANMLTILAMAALGLSVDARAVARSGGRVIAAAMLALLVIGALALGLVHFVGIA